MGMTVPEQLRASMDAWDRYQGYPQDTMPIGDGDHVVTRELRRFLADYDDDANAVNAVLSLFHTEDIPMSMDLAAAMALLEDRFMDRMVQAHLNGLERANPLVAARLRKALDYERLD